jgi:hypothetical protein
MAVSDESYEKVSVSCWDQLYEQYKVYYDSGHQWIFRGHSSSDWKLRTSLERAIIDFRKHGGISSEEDKDSVYREISKRGLGSKKWKVVAIEKRLLRSFQRKAHHYISAPPRSRNRLEWLTLMQHYGAPTRLLDFTYSFFVGLYFAIETAQGKCAIWAIDSDWLAKSNKSTTTDGQYKILSEAIDEKQQEKFFSKFFWDEKEAGRDARVEVINAYRLNDRLAIHQGVFLCPGNVNRTFSENLDATVSEDPDRKEKFHKLVIDVTPSERRHILLHLNRMNINRMSLFPSLQGFGESLTRTFLALTDVMPPPSP